MSFTDIFTLSGNWLLITHPWLSSWWDATGQMYLAYKHNRTAMPRGISPTSNLLCVNQTVT